MQEVESKKSIIIWLISICLLIIFMIMVGGITRLTDSGLSMVEWKPILGAIPPLNEADWLIAFNKYQQFPEFEKINSSMTVSEFKFIYFWEYSHRLTGRLIGVVFFIPMIFFWLKKQFHGNFKYKILFGFILGGLQGLMGWYMVKSGLVDRPDVSHYRLAAHLCLAFFILAYLSWPIFDMLFSSKKITNNISFKWGLVFLILTSIQIVYGAFTAGLDAGLGHNTFPLMGRELIPDFLFEYGAISLFEHPMTIQFIHRWLGTFLFFYSVLGFFYFRLKLKTKRQKIGLSILCILTVVQVLLGIFTLIYVIPLPIAVAHQIVGSLLLIALMHFLHSHKTQ